MRRLGMQGSAKSLGIGLGIATAFVVGLITLAEGTYDTWGALLLAPILFGLGLPALSRQARREGDRTVFWILALALLLKLGGAIVRYYVAYDVYGGGADSAGYHRWGVEISERFRAGNFSTGLDSLGQTNFLRFFTGLVYTVIGPSRLGGFLLFSWLGFWGLFFFYRAFVTAVPVGRSRSYARLVFFLPSLLFWPSSIGKEAWMMFALGMAAFGAARMLSGSPARGAMWAALGTSLAFIPRPHIAGLIGVALAGAFVIRRPRSDLGEVAVVAKGLSVIVVAVVAAVLALNVDTFLRGKGFETDQGLGSTIEQTGEQTRQGGSEFSPSVVRSPLRAPIAVLTVLFRPFPMEAHNAQAFLASMESLFLLGFCLFRFRWGIQALRSIRGTPYVAFALCYAGIFIVAFSGIANFGILARQRVQLLPFFLVLLCIPPRRDVEERPPAQVQQRVRPSG